MQNELREAICFDDFWAAYGPRGFVAMAWWLGAQHAQRIREEQGSFPLLHITGGAGCGKTVLLEYLKKLQGDGLYSTCAKEDALCNTRQRVIAAFSRKVLIYEVRDASNSFDWRELLQMYTGGTCSLRAPHSPAQQITFSGALAICSRTMPIQALENRVIPIELLGFDSSTRLRDSVYRLSQLEASQAECFARLADEYEQEMFEIFNRGALAYRAAIQNDNVDTINFYQARNYGQLMSLVDCLCLLLNLPNEQRVLVQSEVQDMVLFETMPY